jgi:hypothetical protein
MRGAEIWKSSWHDYNRQVFKHLVFNVKSWKSNKIKTKHHYRLFFVDLARDFLILTTQELWTEQIMQMQISQFLSF